MDAGTPIDGGNSGPTIFHSNRDRRSAAEPIVVGAATARNQRSGFGGDGRAIACRIAAWLIMVAAWCSQPGCILLNAFMEKDDQWSLDTTLLEAQGYSVPPGGMPTAVPAEQRSGPAVVLEVRGGASARHLERIPLPTDRAMFIQDLVQEARLHERIGRLKVSIMRPVGSGQPPVRMEVRTDAQGRVTNVGANYALLPQDHIIVVEDDPPGLGQMIMDRLTGK